MKVGDLGPAALGARLRGPGLALRTGPLRMRLRSPLPAVRDGMHLLYGSHPLLPEDGFCDGDITIQRARTPWGWPADVLQATFDHAPVFEPAPLSYALPMVEWMCNWYITAHAHHLLTVHAAVLERDGRAVLLPAASGSGKSTLCAALVHRGWNLLSDEYALLDRHPATGQPMLHRLVRPVSLKNQSIDLLRRFAPQAVLSPPVHGTPKGTLSTMRPPAEQVDRMDAPARPAWVVLPRWRPDARLQLVPLARAQALMALCDQTMNLDLAGRRGFELLADTVSSSVCCSLHYASLDDAVQTLDTLSREDRCPATC